MINPIATIAKILCGPMMGVLPIAGIVGGLFGGGQSETAAAAGPVSQTVNTGAISLGSKFLGRGSVSQTQSADTTSASEGAAITQRGTGAQGGGLTGNTVFVIAIGAATVLGLLLRKR